MLNELNLEIRFFRTIGITFRLSGCKNLCNYNCVLASVRSNRVVRLKETYNLAKDLGYKHPQDSFGLALLVCAVLPVAHSLDWID
jgi:hypothetical protein